MDAPPLRSAAASEVALFPSLPLVAPDPVLLRSLSLVASDLVLFRSMSLVAAGRVVVGRTASFRPRAPAPESSVEEDVPVPGRTKVSFLESSISWISGALDGALMSVARNSSLSSAEAAKQSSRQRGTTINPATKYRFKICLSFCRRTTGSTWDYENNSSPNISFFSMRPGEMFGLVTFNSRVDDLGLLTQPG